MVPGGNKSAQVSYVHVGLSSINQHRFVTYWIISQEIMLEIMLGSLGDHALGSPVDYALGSPVRMLCGQLWIMLWWIMLSLGSPGLC